MGAKSGHIEMKAENAKLTFPHLQEVFDIQDQMIEIQNTNKKFFDYVVSAVGHVPIDSVSRNLVKYALNYIQNNAGNTVDPIDVNIKQHIAKHLYDQLSAEFGEIKRKLQIIEHYMEENKFENAYVDVNSYCIPRCGVLLDLFLSNLDYALAMATLFKELCVVYIGLGLMSGQYDAIHRADVIGRFKQIEDAVKIFKEKAVNQRIGHFNRSICDGVEYTDKLRPDMQGCYIHMPEFMTPNLERSANKQREIYKEYIQKLKVLYNEYFDRIISEALVPAKAALNNKIY